jgi:tail tube protein
MATPERLAGTATWSVDGVQYSVVGDVEWSPSIVERESLVGMDGYHGYSEKPVAAFMQVTGRDRGGVKASAYGAMVGVTVVFRLANGKTVVGPSMVLVQKVDVNSVDATVRLRFEGDQVLETGVAA